jgi:hypothetical protein
MKRDAELEAEVMAHLLEFNEAFKNGDLDATRSMSGPDIFGFGTGAHERFLSLEDFREEKRAACRNQSTSGWGSTPARSLKTPMISSASTSFWPPGIAAKARGGEILASSLLKELTESSRDIRFGAAR